MLNKVESEFAVHTEKKFSRREKDSSAISTWLLFMLKEKSDSCKQPKTQIIGGIHM